MNLRQDKGQDTAIAWVRAHIQIPGNEEADALAKWSSYLGETKGSNRTITAEGIRADGKRERATARSRETFRLGKAVNWKRQAISAYTWMRTNKGPQRQWLYQIKRADSPYCHCNSDNTIQSGEHLTFHCTLHAQARRRLIADQRSWKDLDQERWIKTGPNERTDGVELFFAYLFHQLTASPASPP